MSPWYSWMVRLCADRARGPIPGRQTRRHGGLARPVPRALGRAHRPSARTRPALESRLVAQRIARGTSGNRSYSTPKPTCRFPRICSIPHDRTAPGPAVLAVHGHGPGKDLVCGLTSTEAPNGDYAHRLALAGYVVLAPDLRCFGERADWNPPDHYGCDTNLVHTFMAGESPLAQNLWDMARSLDFLEGHPLVDPPASPSRAFPTAEPSLCSWPRWTSGSRLQS